VKKQPRKRTKPTPQKAALNAAKLDAENKLKAMRAAILKLHTGYEWQPEYRFSESRKWQFDFAQVENQVAIEIEGGVWTGGRHTTGSGSTGDMQKYNAAQVGGWIVLRYTPRQFAAGVWIDDVRRVIYGEEIDK